MGPDAQTALIRPSELAAEPLGNGFHALDPLHFSVLASDQATRQASFRPPWLRVTFVCPLPSAFMT